ncbi:hypothetical protein P3X46_018323 [Hevea brasiliensis]|uniref:J domain-containing protein n=1 Tax=Hevea brasiliensis TaxID=3981 RepID=A0ABQ9LQG3_HEVBR|nr:chaperone protein dnaJ C76, chloroplastic [Hevea brasiliensis]KAJ9170197.1 hypothetical protein P3X46_018323 [Hevea brasiliensis]
MPTAFLPSAYSHSASIIPSNLTPKPFTSFPPNSKKLRYRSASCRRPPAASTSSSITDFDIYDLLGIDSSSDQSHIKMAYRTLQKRCHPDIAGPTGHDMAIILNEAYSVLSDPNSRLAYDKEQAKIAELRGYTGKPIYSVWFGSESEERAVFVDEVKCVGCLKCALFAEKTFAIESVYGRARVVAQWADPEHKIQAAIDTCPVDCISMVERSDLAALEFLMSKQPRGNVRVGAGNTAGARVSNIFVDVKKFQTRVVEAMNKADAQGSKETDPQREARISAIQAIRSISNWLYWQSRKAGPPSKPHQNLPQIAQNTTELNINKLRAAAAARKHASQSTRPARQVPSNLYHEEYWIPSAGALPASTNKSGSRATSEAPKHTKEPKVLDEKDYKTGDNQMNPIRRRAPMVIATIAATIVREQAVVRLNEHIGGALALEIVNSSWLHAILAGITWYIVGLGMIELVEAIRKRL